MSTPSDVIVQEAVLITILLANSQGSPRITESQSSGTTIARTVRADQDREGLKRRSLTHSEEELAEFKAVEK